MIKLSQRTFAFATFNKFIERISILGFTNWFKIDLSKVFVAASAECHVDVWHVAKSEFSRLEIFRYVSISLKLHFFVFFKLYQLFFCFLLSAWKGTEDELGKILKILSANLRLARSDRNRLKFILKYDKTNRSKDECTGRVIGLNR